MFWLISLLIPLLTSPDSTHVKDTMELSQLLPTQVVGWQVVENDLVFDRANIFEYMNGGGEIYLAYDFQRLFVRTYQQSNAPVMVAEIYQMATSGDAFGIFTHDRDGSDINLGQAGLYGAGLLRFWQDRYFVRIYAEQETPASEKAVRELGQYVAHAIQRVGKPPAILQLLPEADLIPTSLHYFHTQISLNIHYYIPETGLFEISPQTEVVLARYRVADGNQHLLLIQYPSIEQAQRIFSQVAPKYFKLISTAEPTSHVQQNQQGWWESITQAREFLILILDAPTRASNLALQKLIQQKIMEAQHESR
ncbi:hypothetical protein L0128_18790 [candidate division KSB1 bacterium]|nr:hypothetical protein [candidate division KSB1 bacterium]